MRHVLTVGIIDYPRLARQTLALVIKHVHLSYSGHILAVYGIKSLDTDVAALGSLAESDLLPSVARFERAGNDRSLCAQIKFFAFQTVGERLLNEKLVEFRLLEAFGFSFFRTEYVKYKNVILTLFQPASRHIESLLRTDFPNSSHRVAIDIYQSLAPCLEIQESVRRLVKIERRLINSSGQTSVGIGCKRFNR